MKVHYYKQGNIIHGSWTRTSCCGYLTQLIGNDVVDIAYECECPLFEPLSNSQGSFYHSFVVLQCEKYVYSLEKTRKYLILQKLTAAAFSMVLS